jgi:hypothetical protein
VRLFTSAKQIKCVAHALLMSIILIPKTNVFQIAFTRETVLKQLVFTCLFSLHLSVYFPANFRTVIQRDTVFKTRHASDCSRT